MRNATVNTPAQRHAVFTITVDNYGTMTALNFMQKLWKAGRVDYDAFNKSRKVAPSTEYATALLNENEDLFPKEF